jgi:hypothetical protein
MKGRICISGAPRAKEQAFDLLAEAYRAFNAREIDAVLALMTNDVVWPNGMEGGTVNGWDQVRAYWTRQWALVDPHVAPLRITINSLGRFDVEVQQLVKDLTGAVLVDRVVHHVYELRDDLIASMEIEE